MAFPATPLDMSAEVFLNGSWVSLPVRRGTDGVTVERGRADEFARATFSTAAFQIDNTTGDWSPRNPLGQYYRYLSRNVPFRVSLERNSVSLWCPGGNYISDNTRDIAPFVTAPDAAALDITGDIDLRADLILKNYQMQQTIISKYLATSTNRSYYLNIARTGQLQMNWSTDGTLANVHTIHSTLPVTVPASGRLAIRATLDVNNGASGHTVTFYTSDTINGSWTQLGDAVVTAGTTTIGSGAAGISLGGNADLFAYPVWGQILAIEIRNGIGGTVVANPNFTIQSAGATSFADTAAAPNTWTIVNGAELTSKNYRMHGEVTTLPQVWDKTGTNKFVDASASGILRRLGQGSHPVQSTIYTSLRSRIETGQLVAYWPHEDSTGSTSVASAVPGGKAMTITTGVPDWENYTDIPASRALPRANQATWTGIVPAYNSTEASVRYVQRLPTNGLANNSRMTDIYLSGTLASIQVWFDTTGNPRLIFVDDNSTTIFDTGYLPTFDMNGVDSTVAIDLAQNGANIDYTITIVALTDNISSGNTSPTASSTLNSRTMGLVQRVTMNPSHSSSDTVFGHLYVQKEITTVFDTSDQLAAYAGEPACERIRRLCEENGVDFRFIGPSDSSALMGAQLPGELMDLIFEAVEADDGLLFEPMDQLALGYRTNQSLYNQPSHITLDYSASELAEVPTPIDDDRFTANDVTVSSTYGSSARQTLETGRLSVLEPADGGVGRYATTLDRSIRHDQSLADTARWQVHKGTVDEARFPTVEVNVARTEVQSNVTLEARLHDAEIGDKLTITNMDDNGVPVPPDDVNQIIQGWTEVMSNFEHEFTFNCTPDKPFQVAEYGTSRYGPTNTTIVNALDTTQTNIDIVSENGIYWQNFTSTSYDILVGGEVMTLTAISNKIFDNFNSRTVANGWGSPNTGPAWTVSGGAASDYSVGGGFGSIAVGSVNVSRFAVNTGGGSDFDIKATVSSSVLATGGSHFAYLVARLSGGTSQCYQARIEFTTAAAVNLLISRRVASSDVTIASTTTSLTHTAGGRFYLRFQVTGSRLRAKVWLASASEPSEWTLSTTDTTITTGTGVGVRSLLASTNTNVLPVTFNWDAFELNNVQTITATRSVNSVVKTHAAGDAVTMASPAIRALGPIERRT